MLHRVNVVIFDFDGTLSESDSSFEFWRYCFKRSWRTRLYFPLTVFGIIIRMFNHSGIFWREISRMFTNKDIINKYANGFVGEHKKRRFGWTKEQVNRERSAGNIAVLISASPDYLINKLINDIKFDAVITSKMDTEKPWKYKFLCWGKNKVLAFDEWATKNKYLPNVVRSYSDSVSDTPIMNIAKDKVWIDSKTGLRK